MKKLLITGDTTTTVIARILEKTFKSDSEALDLQVVDGDFNSWLLQSMDSNSFFKKNQPEYWVQIWSPRTVTDNPQITSQLKYFLDALKSAPPSSKIIVTSFVVDPVMAQSIHMSFHYQKIADELNQMLHDFSAEKNFFHVLNLQSFFTQHGLKAITDSRFEALGRMYFSPNGSELLAKFIARGVKALLKIPQKVMVLDLDNTLWGGILGEDGFDKIKIGGEGAGYLYTRFQQALLALKNNGVLLAVCSKNNEEDALKVFREHPDMLIRLEDLSAYRINWEPKGLNLKSIAQELNLGISSLVFFDDSSFERENVRQLAPEVTVIEVPQDPSGYVQALYDYSGFDTFKVTDEDRKRTLLYQQEAQRNKLKNTSGSLEDFYSSIEMKATLTLAEESDFARVHQLIWKTNQFNLTTRRYDENELKDILSKKDYQVILLRLQDRMGESGVTGVVILKKGNDVWEIENLMLSCRIIGRTVEYALIEQIAGQARKSGAQVLKATFILTEKNQVAESFLDQAGFEQVEKGAIELWGLPLVDYENRIPKNYVTTEIRF